MTLHNLVKRSARRGLKTKSWEISYKKDEIIEALKMKNEKGGRYSWNTCGSVEILWKIALDWLTKLFHYTKIRVIYKIVTTIEV